MAAGPHRPKALMSWSSGKDSAFALERVRAAGELEIVGLLTTINLAADRVAMHGVRVELLRRQARALGLQLDIIELPWPCSNAEYEQRMGAYLEHARRIGVERVVFGDLFLEDIRAYREDRLAGTGIEPVFPLWGSDTRALAEEMLAAGLVAHLSCLDPKALPRELAGRQWDAELLASLPEGVDPCGEHGEFHTFVSDGPGFSEPLSWSLGEIVEREGFVYADMIPSEA